MALTCLCENFQEGKVSLAPKTVNLGLNAQKNPFFHKLLLTVAFIKEMESELVQEGI